MSSRKRKLLYELRDVGRRCPIFFDARLCPVPTPATIQFDAATGPVAGGTSWKKTNSRKSWASSSRNRTSKQSGELEPGMVVICTLAKDFDPKSNDLWDSWGNKSKVRDDVRCCGCCEKLAVSNWVYRQYVVMAEKARPYCMECGRRRHRKRAGGRGEGQSRETGRTHAGQRRARKIISRRLLHSVLRPAVPPSPDGAMPPFRIQAPPPAPSLAAGLPAGRSRALPALRSVRHPPLDRR